MNIGLPKTLTVMLKHMVENNNIKSWNIYENFHGQLCCNIKFDMCDSDDDSDRDNLICAFRRVSKQQQSRNLARTVNQRNKKRKISETPPRSVPRSSPPSDHTPESARGYASLRV